MIIIGYQGVGKSTLRADNPAHVIDLESSNFNFEQKDERGYSIKIPDWESVYCKIAMSLSDQGFIVCMSSHKSVRDYLMSHYDVNKICYIVPDLCSGTDCWLDRLADRYNDTKLDKDLRAWKNAENNIEADVNQMISEASNKGIEVYEIPASGGLQLLYEIILLPEALRAYVEEHPQEASKVSDDYQDLDGITSIKN